MTVRTSPLAREDIFNAAVMGSFTLKLLRLPVAIEADRKSIVVTHFDWKPVTPCRVLPDVRQPAYLCLHRSE